MQIPLSYTELKTRILAKALEWQHVEFDNVYNIFVVESGTHYCTEVYKANEAPKGEDQSQHDTDRADFETNYKSDSNKPAPVAVDPIAASTVAFRGEGVVGVATAGQTTNIDMVLANTRLLNGGFLLTKSGEAAWGDYVVMQVVDVDDILGYGAGVVFGEFINKWYIDPADNAQMKIATQQATSVLAGLYLRCKYTSVGGTNVNVAINYFLSEKL